MNCVYGTRYIKMLQPWWEYNATTFYEGDMVHFKEDEMVDGLVAM